MMNENYFLNGDVKSLPDQRKKFDTDILKFAKKPNSVYQKPQPSPKQEKKPPSSSKLLTETLLEKIQNKRRAYNKVLFDDECQVYDTQLKFLEYEHQMKKNEKVLLTIFESPVPPDKIKDNERAIDKNFSEGDYYSNLKNFYTKNNFDDIRNVNQEEIIKIREFVNEKTKSILNEQIKPEEYPSFGDQNGIHIIYNNHQIIRL